MPKGTFLTFWVPIFVCWLNSWKECKFSVQTYSHEKTCILDYWSISDEWIPPLLLQVLVLCYPCGKLKVLSPDYKLNVINIRFGSLFWLQKVPISLKFGPLSLLFLGSVQMKSPKGIQYMKSQIWKMVLKNSGKVPNHPQALQYRIWDFGLNSKNPYKGYFGDLGPLWIPF